MATLPYIQLYVSDYLADTQHLTAEEHGSYLLLIMNYWQTEKPIPQNRLQGITRVFNDRWESVKQNISEFFIEDENGSWYHERIQEDLEKVKSKSKQASEAGKKSAELRALNKDKINTRSTTVEKPLSECLTIKEEREKKKEKREKIIDINTSKEVEEIYPGWLNVSSWLEWEKYRREIKKKLTQSTKDKQLKFLEANQHQQKEIIDQSIQNGWTGLFTIKQNKGVSSLASNISVANEWLSQSDELENALAIGR